MSVLPKPAAIQQAIQTLLSDHLARKTDEIAVEIAPKFGLSVDSLGFDNSGRPKFRVAVSNSLFRMKKAGSVVSPKRGLFALSGSDVEISEVASKPKPKVKASKPKPKVKALTLNRLVVQPLTQDEIPEWFGDSYLKSLVVKSLPCFGTVDPSKGTCQRCPMRVQCGEALLTKAQALVKEHELQKELELQKAQEPEPVSEPVDHEVPVNQDLIMIQAGETSTCRYTKHVILSGDKAWYSPSTGEVYHATIKVTGDPDTWS